MLIMSIISIIMLLIILMIIVLSIISIIMILIRMVYGTISWVWWGYAGLVQVFDDRIYCLLQNLMRILIPFSTCFRVLVSNMLPTMSIIVMLISVGFVIVIWGSVQRPFPLYLVSVLFGWLQLLIYLHTLVSGWV